MWIGEEAEVVLLCFVLILVTEVVAYIYFEEIMQHNNNKNGKKNQNVASAKLPNVLLGARSASSSRDVMRLTMMRARPKQSFQFENTALHSCCFRGWFFRFVEPARPSESVPWCRHLDSRLESDSMNLTRAQSMLRHAFERKSSAHVRWEDANVHVTHFIPQSTSQKKNHDRVPLLFELHTQAYSHTHSVSPRLWSLNPEPSLCSSSTSINGHVLYAICQRAKYSTTGCCANKKTKSLKSVFFSSSSFHSTSGFCPRSTQTRLQYSLFPKISVKTGNIHTARLCVSMCFQVRRWPVNCA